MVSSSSILLAASAAAGVLAMPAEFIENMKRAYTPSATGTNNGFYYSWWSDGTATATYTNEDAGTYNLQWSGNSGNLVGGKGWNPGSNDR